MAVSFNKPKGMKYTDMCIYIDKHFPEIAVAGEHPDIENTIFEYLYHIVYALACKAGYFKDFSDYDSFAIYAAAELYFSMRKKLVNAGQEVRGKVVVPVKSCLNFIKATLFPLKVNYQQENFASVIDPAVHDGAEAIGDEMRENVQSQYRPELLECYTDAIKEVPSFIHKIIAQSPFRSNPVMCKKLYLSAILTFINNITIPNKLKSKIYGSENDASSTKQIEKLVNAYKQNSDPAILWHLEEDIGNYINLIVIKAKIEFSKQLEYYIHGNDMSDEMLDSILKTAYASYDAREEEE